ncbi:MAG: hypothetical protein WBX15_12785 [Thermoanaerobaculia bacterium]
MKSGLFFTIVFAILFAFPLAAQEQKKIDDLEARITALESRIQQLSQQQPESAEIKEIQRQIEILTEEIESMKVERKVPEAETQQHGLGAAASKVYRSSPGVSFGGYGEMLYQNFSSSSAEAETDSLRAAEEEEEENSHRDSIDYLRAVLYTGYKFNDKVLFNSELEVEHANTEKAGAVEMEFGYLDFLSRPALNVRAGMMLMPVGLINELHEPTAYLGAKRPDVEQVIIPTTWSEIGAGLFGETGNISYRAYLVSGLDSEDFSAHGIREGRQHGSVAHAEDFALVGRLDYSPVEGMIFGGSIYSGNSAQGRTTPSGEPFDAPVTLGELHAGARLRGVSLRALWASGSVGDAAQVNLANGFTGEESIGKTFGGWYAEAGFDLASVLSLGAHSVTPYVRYESYDTQKSVPTGFVRDPENEVTTLTTGVAWKPIPQTVIKVDYQNRDDAENSGVDQFNIALGYIF